MPDYGQPIDYNLHWEPTLDFFKEKEEDPKTDDTQTVTRTKKGDSIVIPKKKPAPSIVTHGPGEFDFPKGTVENSILKLMKADEWQEPDLTGHDDSAMDEYLQHSEQGGKTHPYNHLKALNRMANGKYHLEPMHHGEDEMPDADDMDIHEFDSEYLDPERMGVDISFGEGREGVGERGGSNTPGLGRLNPRQNSAIDDYENGWSHMGDSVKQLQGHHGLGLKAPEAPKSDVENSLLKLMKAPVSGDDEAKWKDPRNTPENFPGNEELKNYQGKQFRANELKVPSEEVDVEISEPGPRSVMDRLRGREGEPVTRTETQRQASQRKIEVPGGKAGQHADFIGGRSKQGGIESYNALGDWRASKGDPNWNKDQIEYYQNNPHLLPTMEEEAASKRSRRFPQQNEPQIYENSVEKSLLKLMKADEDNHLSEPSPEDKDRHKDRTIARDRQRVLDNIQAGIPAREAGYQPIPDDDSFGKFKSEEHEFENPLRGEWRGAGKSSDTLSGEKYAAGTRLSGGFSPPKGTRGYDIGGPVTPSKANPRRGELQVDAGAKPSGEGKYPEQGTEFSRMPDEYKFLTGGPQGRRRTGEPLGFQDPENPTIEELKRRGIQNSLLKLMKGGDEQELNAMDEKNLPKENKESQALVADGDSKRPKSEVGTNDKMFKKAEGPEPSGSSMGSEKAKRWAKIQRNVQANRANQSRQDTLPGFEPEPPEEESDTPDQLEHNVLKVMEHPEDRPQRSTDRLSIKRLQQLREGDADGPVGSKRVAPELSYTSFNAKPHTVPEDLPVKVRNSVKESLEKLMGESRQKDVFNFPSDTPETRMDAPIHPDPTEPETHPEQLQREAEATLNRHTRGGRESGAMGRRLPNDVSDQKFSGGAPERRKTPIGKTDDMEKGGSFWGGSRKQDVPQTPPQQEQPWGRQENEASKDAGIDKRIERLLTSKRITGKLPKLGNLGDTRGQRKKSVENSLVKLMKEGEITPEKVGMARNNALNSIEKVNSQYMQGNKSALSPVAPQETSDQAESRGGSGTPDVGNLLAYRGLNQSERVADLASQAPGAAMDAVTGAAKLGGSAASAVASGIGNLFGGGKNKSGGGQPDTSPMTSEEKYPEAFQNWMDTPKAPETTPNSTPSSQASSVPKDMKGGEWSSGFGPAPKPQSVSGSSSNPIKSTKK